MSMINTTPQNTSLVNRNFKKIIAVILVSLTVSACVGRQQAKTVASQMVEASTQASTALDAVEAYEAALIKSHNNLAKNYGTLEGVYHTSLKKAGKAKLQADLLTVNAEIDAMALQAVTRMATKESETRTDALDKVYRALAPIKTFVDTFETEAEAANKSAAAAGTSDYQSQYVAAAARSRYHRALAVYFNMELEARDTINVRFATANAQHASKIGMVAAAHKKLVTELMKASMEAIDAKNIPSTAIKELEAKKFAELKTYVAAVKASGEGYATYFDQSILYLKAFTAGGTKSFLKAVFTGSAVPVTLKDITATTKDLGASLLSPPKAVLDGLKANFPSLLKAAEQAAIEEGKATLNQLVDGISKKAADKADSLNPNKTTITS